MIEFCCPRCHAPLVKEIPKYRCGDCSADFPIVFGIPDFRVDSPRDAAELELAARLAEAAERVDAETLIGMMFRDGNHSQELIDRRVRGVLSLSEKGDENLAEIASLSAGREPLSQRAALEIGCGAGGSLIAAHAHCREVAGIDIALPWLVIAKARVDTEGLIIPIACAAAEMLPFPSRRFDLILAQDVIEHVNDPDATLRESRRVLGDDGILFLSTPNRFSLTPEPHVRVWGVGLLPRRFMRAYVRLANGMSYDHVWPLSFRDIKRLLNRNGLTDHRVLLPPVPRNEAASFSSLQRIQKAIYDLGRRTPGLRSLLYLVGPFFHVLCFVDGRRRSGNGA
jgi:2-polyprenyl-3-methyl-5-hydroxy-6-metoxy-1,4-benzoquinol methylase